MALLGSAILGPGDSTRQLSIRSKNQHRCAQERLAYSCDQLNREQEAEFIEKLRGKLAVSGPRIGQVYRGAAIFLGANILVMGLLITFPHLVLWLPGFVLD